MRYYSKNNILNKYEMVENIGIQYKIDRVKCQTREIELSER